MREKPGYLRWNAMSLLGQRLSDQGRHAEAEPLLLGAFAEIAPPFSRRKTLDRILELYEARGKPDLAAVWRAKGKR